MILGWQHDDAYGSWRKGTEERRRMLLEARLRIVRALRWRAGP